MQDEASACVFSHLKIAKSVMHYAMMREKTTTKDKSVVYCVVTSLLVYFVKWMIRWTNSVGYANNNNKTIILHMGYTADILCFA